MNLGRFVVGFVTLVLASSSIGAPQAVADEVPGLTISEPSEGFWVVGPPDQSFADGVALALSEPGTSPDVVRSVLETLQDKAGRGEDLNLPGQNGDATSDGLAIVEALTELDNSSIAQRKSRSSVTALGGPTDFELRGYATNGGQSWFVKTQINADLCTSNGCETMDAVRTNWTITPGRTGDRFTFTSIYSPNAGSFKNIYATVLTFRKQGGSESEIGRDLAGEGGDRDGTGSGSQIVTHASQAGRKTIDKVRMQATFTRNSTRYYDGVKTGTATCGTKKNYACYF